MPSVHHELLDMLSNDRSRAKTFLAIEDVAVESAETKVARQIVLPLVDILSRKAKV